MDFKETVENIQRRGVMTKIEIDISEFFEHTEDDGSTTTLKGDIKDKIIQEVARQIKADFCYKKDYKFNSMMDEVFDECKKELKDKIKRIIMVKE